MRGVIQQSVVLPTAADALFDAYLDPAEHEAITGAVVTIGTEAGAEFRAFDGVLTGAILAVISPRLIVQSWRSTEFRVNDPDSITTRKTMVHIGGKVRGHIDRGAKGVFNRPPFALVNFSPYRVDIRKCQIRFIATFNKRGDDHRNSEGPKIQLRPCLENR